MKVKLISTTQNLLDVLFTGARTCYSAGSPIDMFKDVNNIPPDKKLKLINGCIKSSHLSVLEHSQFTFAIEGVSRALTHQLVRHRHCSFCLSGDTVIKMAKGRKVTIAEAYKKQKQYQKSMKIRCVNEETKELLYDHVSDFIFSGKKELYEVRTNLGYSIKSTLEHRFLTDNGWKRLKELSVGDIVYVNGIPAYKDREWLNKQYNELNLSQEEIGEYCNVSKHTIRQWISRFGLQKPMGSWSIGREPVNKGRTKFDYEPMMRTSQKMMGNTNFPIRKGKDNNFYRGDLIGEGGGCYRSRQNFQKVGVCSNCGKECKTHIHHIDKNPKNYSQDNMIELCQTCHKAIHFQEVCKVIIPNTITSIEHVGIEDTYDICMAGEHHNFIANGFVVHNSQQSQRYVNLEGTFDYVTPKALQDEGDLQGYFTECMQQAYESYTELIDKGVKPEDARAVLPNACCTNMVITLNLRSLIHLCNERLCTRAQLEIRQLVQQMVKEVLKENEWLKPYLQPKCESLGYCPEHKSCGRKPSYNQLVDKE